MRRFTLLLGAAVLGIVFLGACSRGAPGSGPMLLEVDGRALVTPPSGDPLVVEGQRRLEVGTRVEMVEGTAVLALPDQGAVELRTGVGPGRDDTRLEASASPRLLAGDVLVLTDDGPTEVSVGATTIRVGAGAAKVSRGLALSAQVYEGLATVESAGRSLDVPALRQAVVPATRLVPAAPSPLAYNALDPWDRRYLAEAIELGETMAAKAQGFTNQLRPGEGRTAGFYRLLLPELESQPGFDQPLLSGERSPGETLVGSSIAVVAAGEQPPDAFVARWQAIFAFRDAGAEWGLVALDNGVTRDALVDRVDRAIAALSLGLGAPGSPGSPPGLDGGGGGDGGDGGSPSPTPSSTPTTQPPQNPPPSTPPTTSNCTEEEQQSAAGTGGFQTAAECPRQRTLGDVVGVDGDDDNQGGSSLADLLGGLVSGDDGSDDTTTTGGLLGIVGNLLVVGALGPAAGRRRRRRRRRESRQPEG